MDRGFCVLIPAYKPGEGLVKLVADIKRHTLCPIIVIDDGSGSEFRRIFNDVRAFPGCDVISYDVNRGKGYAMKQGFKRYLEKYGCDSDLNGVVTADADGQHLLKDIIRVGEELSSSQEDLVLGVRKFGKDVPLRSKIGNNITIFVYSLASRRRVSDTQTGLRGIPAQRLKQIMELDGDRYEYEMNMLLALKELKMGVKEIVIETVYIDDNSSSHFNPIKDSIRIYRLIFRKMYALKYALSSIASAVIDFLIYMLFLGIGETSTGFLAVFAKVGNAQIPARAVSSVFNFFANKNLVFNNKDKSARGHFIQGISYFALVIIGLFLVSRPINGYLNSLGMNTALSYIIASTVQYIFNFIIQKYVVFRRKKRKD